MFHEESQYLILLTQLIDKFYKRGAHSNRTSVKTVKIAGGQMRFNLSDGKVPVFTTKYVHLKSVIHELLWFLKGDTNIQYLKDHKVKIWDKWALDSSDAHHDCFHSPGSLGPIYGAQWRHFPAGNYFYNQTDAELEEYIYHMAPDQLAILKNYLKKTPPIDCANDFGMARLCLTNLLGIDQIAQALMLLQTNPTSRRIVITAWNPQVVPSDAISPQENVLQGRAALASCHCLVQFVTEELTLEERLALIKADWKKHHNAGIERIIADETTIEQFLKANGDQYPKYRLNCILYQRKH